MASLGDIFDASHALSRGTLRALDDKDLRELRRIALGDEPGVNRARAAEALVRARPEEGPELLAEILGSEQEDVALRAQAASLLSLAPRQPAESVLVAELARRPDPLVASKIAGSLARIGGRQALDVLGGLVAEGGFAGRRARLAQLVIAHRIGIADFRPELPSARDLLPVPSEGLPVRVSSAKPPELREFTASIGPDAYGLQLRNATALSIRCGRERLLAVVDGRFSPTDLRKEVLSRPVLVGIVAERAEVTPTYSTSWVILAGPLDAGIAYVVLYRPDGELAFAGEATADATFALRAVRRPGARPAEIKGAVRGTRLSLAGSLSAARPRRASTPAAG